MPLVAAFLWKKAPNPSISTLIFDEETVDRLLPPQIQYLSTSYFRFRSDAKKCIKHFFMELLKWQQEYQTVVRVEYKIVLDTTSIPYLIPARESRYVYQLFMYWLHYVKKRTNKIKVAPQLRKRLSGKSLRYFNRDLRHLRLVNRRQDTRFEYTLWAVALHATPSTYEDTIEDIKAKLLNKEWEAYR